MYSNAEITSSWKDIEVTIKLYLAGLFEVIISPQIQNKESLPYQTQRAANVSLLNNTLNSFTVSNSSLIPSKTFDGREKLQDQLHSIGCTFVVLLKEEECNASIEVLRNRKFYHVKNPSGLWFFSLIEGLNQSDMI